jgi:hypothetical protein
MGWGTFIAGQTIRIVRRSGKHRYPITRPSGPTFFELMQKERDKPKLTEQEEIELQKLKYEKREQKKLLKDRGAQERRVTRKNLKAKELEPEQLDKDRDNLSWRQQNYLASKKGQAQRESLAFKILLVLTVVFGGFLLYGVIVVFLA